MRKLIYITAEGGGDKENLFSFFVLTFRRLHLRNVGKLILPLFMPKESRSFDAEAFLESLSHDPNHSDLCSGKRISPQYDLQIIVPVYNVERYIIDCMESVVHQQTRFTYLITAINDGSSDHSRELLQCYEDLPHVEVIDQKNRGFSGARNAALKNIKGRYVMFLDSDDSLEKGAIEALMTKAEQSGADMVEGGFRQFDDAGNTIYTQIYEPREHLPSLNGFPWGKVIRSEMFKNLQFPENYWYETLFFLLMFDMAKNIARIDNSIYHYRLNFGGITK